jgi:hypothetical protein
VSMRDRLPRRVPTEPVSHLEADEQANSGDPQGTRKPSSDAKGEAQWAVVTYVPYDPSFETPDEGGPSGRLTGASIPTRAAQPSSRHGPASAQNGV